MLKLFVGVLVVGVVLFVLLVVSVDDFVINNWIGFLNVLNKFVFCMIMDGLVNNMLEMVEGYKKFFEDFIKKYFDWQIEMQFMIGDIGQEQVCMFEQVKFGFVFDCVVVDFFVLFFFKKVGVLKFFLFYFKKEEVEQFFLFICEGVIGFDGQIYVWWWSMDFCVFYCNKDIVLDVLQIWDDLKKVGFVLVKKGMEGIFFNGSCYEGMIFDWVVNFWVQGGDLVDKDGKLVFGEGDNKVKFVKVVNFYCDFVELGVVFKCVVMIGNYDDFNVVVVVGMIVFFVGGNWQFGQLKFMFDVFEFVKWIFLLFFGLIQGECLIGIGGWMVVFFFLDVKKVVFCVDIVCEVYMGLVNEVQGQLLMCVDFYGKYKVFFLLENKVFVEVFQKGCVCFGVLVYLEILNQIQIMMGKVLIGVEVIDKVVDEVFVVLMVVYQCLK